VSGGFAAAPNGGDALLDALYGLKAEYRANAMWGMNRATTAVVRKLKDSDGTYLWSPGIAAGQPASLLGYPVASFEDMPSPGASSLSIVVGDMRAAYQIVDRMGIRVLRDPFSAKPFVGFYSTKRVGGDVVNFEAIKALRLNT
jgi:HK97 family phage major capsid protein